MWTPPPPLDALLANHLALYAEAVRHALREQATKINLEESRRGTLYCGQAEERLIDDWGRTVSERSLVLVRELLHALGAAGQLSQDSGTWLCETMTRQIDGLARGLVVALEQRRQRLSLPARQDDSSPIAGADELKVQLGRFIAIAVAEADLRRGAAPPIIAPIGGTAAVERTAGARRDVFICHASEDKAAIARPLAEGLKAQGVSVWFDEFELQLGDSLPSKIDEGLASSRFGIVILSPDFFRKKWPRRELDGLAAREVRAGKKVILPIWHGVGAEEVEAQSPTLASKLAVSTEAGHSKILSDILRVIQESPQAGASVPQLPEATETTPAGHQTINAAIYLAPGAVAASGPGAIVLGPGAVQVVAPPSSKPTVQDDAMRLLLAASRDKTAAVIMVATFGGLSVLANGEEFVERGNPRSEARWRAVVRDLERRGLLEQTDRDGHVFSMTDEGYRATDGLT